MTEIRSWDRADLPELVRVDQAATELFRTVGLDLPGDDPAEVLRDAREVLVTGRPPVGFAALEAADGRAHLAEIAVLPEHGRRGLGTALLTAALDWARRAGYPAITLTTFRSVPFNGPWYLASGFVELPEAEWGPELRRIRAAEEAAGIAVAPRMAMIHPLG